MALYERLMEAAEYIKDKAGEIQIGLVLGSAQGVLVNYVENAVELDYKDIPNFQMSTAPAHAGKLIIGDFGGKRVACMGGRLHCYEGYAAYGVPDTGDEIYRCSHCDTDKRRRRDKRKLQRRRFNAHNRSYKPDGEESSCGRK